jgi:hypothetical protein
VRTTPHPQRPVPIMWCVFTSACTSPKLSGKRSSTHARGTQLVCTKLSNFNGVALVRNAVADPHLAPTAPRRPRTNTSTAAGPPPRQTPSRYIEVYGVYRVLLRAVPRSPARKSPPCTTHDSLGRNRQVRGNGVRMAALKKQNAPLKSLCVLPNAPQLPLHVTVPARTAHDATRQVGARGNTARRTPHGLSAEREKRSGTARRQLPPRRRDLASGSAKTVHQG